MTDYGWIGIFFDLMSPPLRRVFVLLFSPSSGFAATPEASPLEARDLFFCVLLAFLLVTLNFLLQGHVGVNFADEGFLWYGVMRTAVGEVPIRDFVSYDPFRYYWGAVWARLLDDGVVSLRLALAAFELPMLVCGLLIVRRITTEWWALTLIGVVLLAWMTPQHKCFDHGMAIVGVYVGVLLIESPSLARHFMAGVFVGFAAFVGRNHGLYLALGFLALIIFIERRILRGNLLQRGTAWGLGILVGYSPLLIMLVAVPNFAAAFWESVMFIIRQGATNLPLPVPWPWRVDYARLDWFMRASQFLIGCGFILMPLFYVCLQSWLWFTKRDNLSRYSVLIASAFIGVFFMHQAFARAGFAHLAQASHPLLFGIVALPSLVVSSYRRASTILIVSLMFLLSIPPIVGRSVPYAVFRIKNGFARYRIGNDQLWLRKTNGALIRSVERIVAEHVAPEEQLLIAPHWPTFYCLLRRKSPVKQTYFLFPELEHRELEMLTALKSDTVRWALLGDVALDKREELRFRHTHRRLWRYLITNFEPVKVKGLPRNYQFLRKKAEPQVLTITPEHGL